MFVELVKLSPEINSSVRFGAIPSDNSDPRFHEMITPNKTTFVRMRNSKPVTWHSLSGKSSSVQNADGYISIFIMCYSLAL